MSSLVPRDAVTLLYRRYLKAAYLVSNATLRSLLISQIRGGFRRNRGITAPALQQELIEQAIKDLNVLEDARLSRTLFINSMGQVTCLDWEVRRTEFHFYPGVYNVAGLFLLLYFAFVGVVVATSSTPEVAQPEVVRMVEEMKMRLEAGSLEEQQQLRARQVMQSMQRREQRDELEQRVLATFYNAPPLQSHNA